MAETRTFCVDRIPLVPRRILLQSHSTTTRGYCVSSLYVCVWVLQFLRPHHTHTLIPRTLQQGVFVARYWTTEVGGNFKVCVSLFDVHQPPRRRIITCHYYILPPPPPPYRRPPCKVEGRREPTLKLASTCAVLIKTFFFLPHLRDEIPSQREETCGGMCTKSRRHTLYRS